MIAVKLHGVMADSVVKIQSPKPRQPYCSLAALVAGRAVCSYTQVMASSAVSLVCNFPMVISKITYFKFL